MAGDKVFIGPKLRELRRNRNLTQVQLARDLGVSASYINLIERNQRSASLKFLITLSDTFGLDWREFTGSKESTALSDLRDMTRDPAFGDTLPDIEELRSALDGSPNLMAGILNIYNTYQAYGQRLAEQSEALLSDDTALSSEQSVHDFFRSKNNYFQELEDVANHYSLARVSDRAEIYMSLRNHLSDVLKVEVCSIRHEDLGASLRNYDPETRVLQLSDVLDYNNKVFQLAHMIALIEFPEVLLNQMPEALRERRSAERIKVELANYFAAALMMPYDEFHEEAKTTRYDIDRLAARFGVSYEQVCHRLATLQKPGARGIPFFFLRVDRAGNVSKRLNATPIQLARFGGACPRLDVHYCFRVPGRILTQLVEMPDNSKYLTINRTVDRPSISYSTEERRQSVSLGCSIHHAQETIYGAQMNLTGSPAVTEIGVNCRLCPRKQCNQRAHDPFFSELQLDANRRGITAFES